MRTKKGLSKGGTDRKYIFSETFHITGISHSQNICAYFVCGIINELPQSYDNPYKQSHLSSGRMVFGGSTKIMGLYHPQDPSRCPIRNIEFFYIHER